MNRMIFMASRSIVEPSPLLYKIGASSFPMSARGPRPVARLLSNGGTSAPSRLRREGEALRRLETRLRKLLPAELADHARVGQLKAKCLIIYADSPAWAARLRFLAPQLVKQLRETGAVKPATIQIRVLPGTERPQPPRRQASLSEDSRRLIEQTARGIDDEKLASALRRLARRRR
ncbi:MAG TPA: DUF721 domain-containing protein [Thiotrichales bacterium]|nr:DUF721 domain-containing protein [Thiotrichales bacterium]